MAASLTRFSRSAPTNPGVDLANNGQVNIWINRFTFDMNFQDRFTTAHIWTIQHNTAVKAAGAEQGWIKNIRAVGSSHDDDIGIGIKTIHLDQHLVQCLFTFVMTSAKSSTALAANCINFIHKDDTG